MSQPKPTEAPPAALPVVKGTLDLLALKALAWAPMHGFEVVTWIEQRSRSTLQFDDSAVYQALYRMEKRGLVTAEWGIAGLILYLGLIASTLLMLAKIKRRSTPGDGMFYRALALQVGLIATLTASSFSDRLYGESFYWMCALAVGPARLNVRQFAH